MRNWLLIVFTLGIVTVASAQVAEISVSGGGAKIGGGSPGSEDVGGTSPITIKGGFTLGIRLTLNNSRFFGHEFGYAYSRTNFEFPSSGELAVNVNGGFYDFLVYATPEGKKIRPFVCGGVGFSSFSPSGSSGSETKYGVNYGAGIKVRVSEKFGVRFDYRQYNTGQPFGFPNSSGRLLQNAFTGGFSLNL